MSEPANRTALVTGASRGIGRAICLRLARDGYNVIGVARHQGELDTLSAEIAATGGRCRGIALDLRDAGAVSSGLSGLDVSLLVNNAGVGIIKPFTELASDDWHQMVDVNINALFHVTRALLPQMLARGEGHVCTVGSISGRSAFLGGSCYAATKAFVTSWAESLLLEVRDRGVKISVVMPGGVATEFGGKQPTEADNWKLSAEDVAESVAFVASTPRSVLVHRLEVRTMNSPPVRK